MLQSTALAILKSGRNVFLTGQAGSGKTYVINQYITRLQACGIRVAITASTGIAATHVGGVTIHSWAGIGIKDVLTPRDLELIAQKEHIYKNITGSQVLIIDEISMLSATTLDMVEQVIQHIRQDYRAWGGMQVVVIGDFFQLPPVTKGQTKDFAFAGKSWKSANWAICYLHTQHRQSDDQFTPILNAMRNGSVSQELIDVLRSRVGVTLGHHDPIKLYTHNVDVERLNLTALDELQGEEVSYEMKAVGDPRFVKILRQQISSSDFLTLKIGAKVIFTKNNPVKGYYNGTTGVVTGWHHTHRWPIVEVRNGSSIRVEPESWNIEDRNEIVASVTQLPLKLAWAITIHKSQGMTLDAAEIDLSRSFEAGQAYVALSRIRSLDGLRLIGINVNGLDPHPLTLRADRYFQEQSDLLDHHYASLSVSDLERIHCAFVQILGGQYVADVDHSSLSVKPLKTKPLSHQKSPGSTYAVTLELVKQHKTIEDIAMIRELSVGTIVGHLVKLKQLYPELSLHRYKPPREVLSRIQDAIKQLTQHSPDTNAIQLPTSKELFDYCGGEIDYSMIKLCMLWHKEG